MNNVYEVEEGKEEGKGVYRKKERKKTPQHHP